MNNRPYENWKFEVISQILIALAKNEPLKNNLVFKGALILNKYLPTQRRSLDIDANFVSAFINNFPEPRTAEIVSQKAFGTCHLLSL
jgi:predicted nucleotidyltransferase component of viral defense system